MWRSVTEDLRLGRWRPAGLLALVVAAVFGPALAFDFVRWDDPVNVTHNPLITEPWSWDLVARLLTGETALRFKPLPWLLYRGVHAVAGFHPAAWHALSLVLHLSAVLMFHAVLRALLGRLRPDWPEPTRAWLAWVGAAAWAVHPAHVEAACWVTATPYPLVVLCLLASFWYYVRAVDPATPNDFRRNLLRAWLLALAGYATYPVGATYALWLMAADVWLFRRAPADWRDGAQVARWLGRHALFLLPAVVGVLVTMKSSSATPWLYPAPPTLAEVGVLVRLKLAAAMLGSVWTNFLWPFGQTPNNPMLPSWRVDGALILALATLSVLGVAATWWRRGRFPGAAAVVLGSALLALPVLGLGQWPHWAVADRHVYLPHLVLAGALVAWPGWARVFPTRPRLTQAALLVGVAGLALLGRRQVMIWQDTDTLFRYIEAQPAFSWNAGQQAYIYRLWAAHAQEQGRTAEALARNKQARQILQEGTLEAAGHAAWAEAVEFSRLLEQDFGLPPPLRRERARWLLTLDRITEAGGELHRVAREIPDDPETRELLGVWRQKQAAAPAGNHL